ncbi:MAG: ATP-dependent Clp protease proteolytic subunit [Myxococcales bacterium]|nr:ATP-dependent Clp protease proteolytic subunit [Myxococcales bacterium]
MPREQDDRVTASPPDSAFLERAAEALFASRTVLVFGEVDTRLAQTVSAQLFALAASSDAPIRVVLHSQGGHVEAGDTIHDVVRAIAPPVVMIGTGWVASAGALIYAAADKERRFALPNTRFLLHEPRGGVGGVESDVAIEAEQIVRMRERLCTIFARATGRDKERVAADTLRNFWMSATEAREYGLVHRVVERLDELDAA